MECLILSQNTEIIHNESHTTKAFVSKAHSDIMIWTLETQLKHH